MSAEVLPEPIQPGTRLALASVRWDETPRSVLLLMTTSCPACQSSVGFYRRVVARVSKEAGLRFIVAFSEPTDAVRQWLDTNEVETDQLIRVSSLLSIGALGTPTILIVGSDGVVTDVMVGELSRHEEALFVRRLAREPQVPPLNNMPSAVEVDNNEFERLSEGLRTQVLDPRDRASYEREHRAQTVNIPFDELYTRAQQELMPTAPVFIDCSFASSILECRRTALVLQLLRFPRIFVIEPSTLRN